VWWRSPRRSCWGGWRTCERQSSSTSSRPFPSPSIPSSTPDPGGGVHLVAQRAAPGAARTHSAGDRDALCGPPGRALRALAHHYSRSGNTPKAVDYLQRAGQQAAQRSVLAEAATHLTRPGPAPDAAGEPGAAPAGTGAALTWGRPEHARGDAPRREVQQAYKPGVCAVPSRSARRPQRFQALRGCAFSR